MNMGKKKTILGVCVAGVFLFGGCGLNVPSLSEEEEDKIAEYAADLVLSRVEDYDSRLVDLSLYPETEMPNEEETGKMDEVADTPVIDNSDPEPDVDDSEIAGSGQGLTESGSLEEILLPEGVTLEYTGFDLVDSYPKMDENPVFILEAGSGKKILLLRFNMKNTGSSETYIDVASKMPVIRYELNGKDMISGQSSLLLDDLSTYVGTLSAGENIPVVLVAEIDDNYMIKAIKVSATSGEQNIVESLQ